MIITCPNCQTKYQLAEKAISSAGRKVQCAHCRQSWLAHAESEPPKTKERPKPKLVDTGSNEDRLFDEASEAELDREFESQEAKAKKRADDADADTTEPEAGNPDTASAEPEDIVAVDPVKQNRLMAALKKRQARLLARLPLAKARRHARAAGVLLLALVLTGGVTLRMQIVRMFPDLGGVYEMLGLGVNIVGLEFGDVQTLRTLRKGANVMLINGHIRSVSSHNVDVPPVLVSILGENAEVLYQWMARSPAQFLAPGESVAFETQLNSAPANAARVRLTFALDQSVKTAGASSPSTQDPAGK